ncbi:hypothetical protein EG68_06927 [Paragonimus skrjabini miyazakii]|uniref:Uncharacterized protein n=1 Tax=Paragonimus skrjabini miyazakii TaxID=59628 RepID=A0A8S9YB02_9TREM|nr:hypothetical protein EG68_06927 [Paragonimus skrjabini miyazakii]
MCGRDLGLSDMLSDRVRSQTHNTPCTLRNGSTYSLNAYSGTRNTAQISGYITAFPVDMTGWPGLRCWLSFLQYCLFRPPRLPGFRFVNSVLEMDSGEKVKRTEIGGPGPSHYWTSATNARLVEDSMEMLL